MTGARVRGRRRPRRLARARPRILGEDAVMAIDPVMADGFARGGREPLVPGPPRRWLGWVRGSRRRRGVGRIPIWMRAVVAVAVTVGLGAWGFRELHSGRSPHPLLSWPESFYRALKLYTLDLGPAGGGPGSPHPNWQLWVALALAALLVLRALLALGRDRIRRVTIGRFLRGHVIVCGGGVHGTELVAAFAGGREERKPREYEGHEPGENDGSRDVHDVVLIDADAGSPGMQAPPARCEWRMIANAVLQETLLSAGAARAHMVVANTGNDFVNSQIASAVRDLSQGRKVKDRVHVLVQVEDPSLTRFLEEETELPSATSDAEATFPVVSPYSANAIAADALIRESKVKLDSGMLDDFLKLRWSDGRAVAPNLLLAGDHLLLEAVLLVVLRRWRVWNLRALEEHVGTGRPPLHVSVFGPGAAARIERLRNHWLPESQVIRIEAFDTDPIGDGPAKADERRRKGYEWLREPGRADHAIVACLEELDGVALTLDLSRALGDRVLVTRVTTQPESVLDEHLEERTKRSSSLATTEVKSVARLGCNPKKMTRLSGPQRLADALVERDPPGVGLKPEEAHDRSAKLFDRTELELHSDSTWRVLPCERPLLEQLVHPVPVSAVVSAGLTVHLASPQNLLTVARALSGSAESFTAWCEYARHVDASHLGKIHDLLPELERDERDSKLLENAMLNGVFPAGATDISAPARPSPTKGHGPPTTEMPAPYAYSRDLIRAPRLVRVVIAVGATAASLALLFEIAKRALGWFELPGGATSAGGPTKPQADVVDCTVFAPPLAAAGQSILVQVFAHLAEQTEDARALATEFDPGTRRRVFQSLQSVIPQGATLTFELRMRNAEIDAPVQTLVWRGRAESVQFEVALPRDTDTGTLIGTVLTTLDGAPIGHVKFKLDVAPEPQEVDQEPAGEVAIRYRAAFVSYASADRDQVLERVQMLNAVRVSYFQDLLDLEPGDRWWPRLQAAIDECDLFILFWSSSAKRSPWVRKEVEQALRRQAGNELSLPEIRPVILEGPPLVEPWGELAHLHFNDRVLYFMSPGGGTTGSGAR